jgi:hypothetical protein
MPTAELATYDSLYRHIAKHSMEVRARMTATAAAEQAVTDVLRCVSSMNLEHLASDERTPASPLRRIAHAAVVDLLTTADHHGGEVVGALSALAEALETGDGTARPLDARHGVISGTIALHRTF